MDFYDHLCAWHPLQLFSIKANITLENRPFCLVNLHIKVIKEMRNEDRQKLKCSNIYYYVFSITKFLLFFLYKIKTKNFLSNNVRVIVLVYSPEYLIIDHN